MAYHSHRGHYSPHHLQNTHTYTHAYSFPCHHPAVSSRSAERVGPIWRQCVSEQPFVCVAFEWQQRRGSLYLGPWKPISDTVCAWMSVCVCACACLCHQSVKRQPSSKRESALCAEVRTLESALRVQRTSLWDDRWVVCVFVYVWKTGEKDCVYVYMSICEDWFQF